MSEQITLVGGRRHMWVYGINDGSTVFSINVLKPDYSYGGMGCYVRQVYDVVRFPSGDHFGFYRRETIDWWLTMPEQLQGPVFIN